MCDPGKHSPGVPRVSVQRKLQDPVTWESLPHLARPVCLHCDKPADWYYAPAEGGDYCDGCVPRGCSCNVDADGNEELDADGSRLPCCEYLERMKLTPISHLFLYIPERTLQRWCEEGDIQAEKIDGHWHVDLSEMLRRNGMDVLADHLDNQEKD